MLSTRYATQNDLPDVYVMYLAALEERKTPKINEGKALNYVLESWARAPCILLELNGGVIGFAGLTTIASPYSDMVSLRDYMFYIQPPHRGLRSWRKLCKAVQDVSDLHKIPFIGEHLLDKDINSHLRLIRSAGASPLAILAVYGENHGF